jgi:hypothetical protein
MAAGHVKSVTKTGLRLPVILRHAGGKQFALEPMPLGFPEALPFVACYSQHILQQRVPFLGLFRLCGVHTQQVQTYG